MKTLHLKETDEDFDRGAEIIRDGGLVAFPTETVYGLGADALNPDAVLKIYRVKGRPADNPSIVHIADYEDIRELAAEVTEDMEILMKTFWPGPMTMIVPAKEIIPKVTTGGLDTVGIRMPRGASCRELVRRSGCPIAAPSANISGKPSPTEAQHVIDDFEGKIEAVIDGGPCQVGIESMVIDMTGSIPMILRPGILTRADFERALGKRILLDPTLNRKPDPEKAEHFRPKAPGQKYRHYAPKAPMIIFEGKDPEQVRGAMDAERLEREQLGQNVCVIDYEPGEERKAAKHFFARLREADREGVDVILAAALPENGVGFSVMNRMLKSAGFNIRKVD